jgi:hypothetical protein
VDLENSPYQLFTHDGLVAYVDVIQSTRNTSRTMDGEELDLKRLTSLMTILKGGYRFFDSFETHLLRLNFSCSDLSTVAWL